MNITATNPTSNANSPATSGYTGLGPDDFLKLLIAELKTQSPENPLDTQAMVTQLSTMEMVAESRSARQSQDFMQAIGMIERTVTWQDAATGALSSGQVSGVVRDGSEARLVVGGTLVNLQDVQTIS